MAAKNIDEFNEITGKVFARLYEAFPIPVLLQPSDFDIDEHAEGDWDHHGRFVGGEPLTSEERMFGESIRWLEESGYLTFGPGNPGEQDEDRTHFQRSRLTAKGLEVLNAIPPNLTKREPLGQQLAAASKSGGKELLRTITTEALGIGVQIGAKALGL